MKSAALLLLLSLPLALPVHASTPPDEIPIYAVSLIGSPYRLGGTSPATGLDCSGFVGHVFRQAAGVTLPRDSRAISEVGQPLAASELQPGDLVFFNTLNRAYSHVGIYLGDNRFVHAASSR
ncbi:MAG: C40 family peptidase, partial [Gammaproteobacteria bacterium]